MVFVGDSHPIWHEGSARKSMNAFSQPTLTESSKPRGLIHSTDMQHTHTKTKSQMPNTVYKTNHSTTSTRQCFVISPVYHFIWKHKTKTTANTQWTHIHKYRKENFLSTARQKLMEGNGGEKGWGEEVWGRGWLGTNVTIMRRKKMESGLQSFSLVALHFPAISV